MLASCGVSLGSRVLGWGGVGSWCKLSVEAGDASLGVEMWCTSLVSLQDVE